jgi:hypothetical protein
MSAFDVTSLCPPDRFGDVDVIRTSWPEDSASGMPVRVRSHAEVAEIMSCSIGEVRYLEFRALAKLRRNPKIRRLYRAVFGKSAPLAQRACERRLAV